MNICRLLLLLLFVMISCQKQSQPVDVGADRKTLQASHLYNHFTRFRQGYEPLVWAFCDLDNNGLDDLIIIYRITGEKNGMSVVLDRGSSCVVTNEVPAPVSNQIIKLRDIDAAPPMEFIVQGMKGTHIGYAVYRIVNGALVDLFNEGMEGCCG